MRDQASQLRIDAIANAIVSDTFSGKITGTKTNWTFDSAIATFTLVVRDTESRAYFDAIAIAAEVIERVIADRYDRDVIHTIVNATYVATENATDDRFVIVANIIETY